MEYTSVTLYHNAGFDPDTRTDTWTRSVCTRALWHGTLGAQAARASKELENTSEYTVRIFTRESLSIAPGDILVLGDCPALSHKEISRDTPRCNITSVIDARKGSVSMQHWKIGGA